MQEQAFFSFRAALEIIGVNPYVYVPEEILEGIFVQAGKSKGTIPICGTVNGKPYTQTLVRFSGAWRLYINLTMLKNSPQRIGEWLDLTLAYDPIDRSIAMPSQLQRALEAAPAAMAVFEGLSPSRRHEILRYIARLKSEETIALNVTRAIDFLLGKGRFVGRDRP